MRSPGGTRHDRPGLAPLQAALVSSVLACALLAAADSQFQQWTSYAVTPALLAAAWAGVFLALLIPTALPTVGFALWRAADRQEDDARIFAVAFTAAWLTYQLARVKMTRTLGLSDAGFLFGLAVTPLLAAALGAGLPARARRGWLVAAAAFMTAASMAGWIVVSRTLGTTPNVVLALARSGSTLGYPLRSVSLFAVWATALLVVAVRARTAGTLLVGVLTTSLLIQAGTMPIAPGWIAPTVDGPDERPAGAADAPDIFLIVLDTVRADHLSAYGHPHLTTPTLDELATGASLYRQAYANATWSLPSHASMLTGLLPHEHDADFAITATPATSSGEIEVVPIPLQAQVPTLPERLRQAGYRTGLIAANHAFFAPDFGLTRGFDHAVARPANVTPFESLLGPMVRRSGLKGLIERYESLTLSSRRADDILPSALAWLDESDRSEAPVFLTINLMDAHDPAVNGPVAERTLDQVPSRGDGESALEHDYDLSLALLDHALEEFFAELRRRDRYDSSLIVITSDHGETFYEDGTSSHARDVFQPQVHVPLIVRAPGQTEGRVYEHPVQLVDLFPTILQAVGVDDASGSGAALPRGTQPVLRNLLSNTPITYALTLETVDLARPSSWGVVIDRHKYILLSDGSTFLFDLGRDPAESRNLVAELPDLANDLDDALRSRFPAGFETAHLRLRPRETLDPTTLERLRSLGYIR